MAEKMESIKDLMAIGLTYVLDFEDKASEEAKKMAQAASNPEAKQVFEQSVTKGKEYAQRLHQVFGEIGIPVKTSNNQIAEAMISEIEHMIEQTDASPVRDAALIVAANQIQHYRVACYGSLRDYAELIGKPKAAEALKQNLDDSKGGDEKLTRIAKDSVNERAAQAAA